MVSTVKTGDVTAPKTNILTNRGSSVSDLVNNIYKMLTLSELIYKSYIYAPKLSFRESSALHLLGL